MNFVRSKYYCNSLIFSLVKKNCNFEIRHRNLNIYSCNYFIPNHTNSLATQKLRSRQNTTIHNSFKVKSCYLNHSRSFSLDPGSFIMWLSQTPAVLSCQNYLQYVHTITNLPWWLTIVLITVSLRMMITFPLTVYQHIIIAKFQNLQPEIKKVATDLREEAAIAAKIYRWPENYTKYMYKRSLKKRIVELIIRDNCHPFKSSLVMWVQLPLWISISCAFRNMSSMMPFQDLSAEITFLELSTGGFAWIPNLTVNDSSLILPILLGLINLTVIEIHALKSLKVNNKFRMIINNLMRAVSIALIPIAANVPSCMALYWTISSFLGLLQNIFLSYPSIRRTVHIPQTAEESQTPWQDIVNNFQQKIGKLK